MNNENNISYIYYSSFSCPLMKVLFILFNLVTLFPIKIRVMGDMSIATKILDKNMNIPIKVCSTEFDLGTLGLEASAVPRDTHT